MSVKEQIKVRVETLDEKEELQVVAVLDQLEAARQINGGLSFLERLQQIQFDGPEDMSRNVDFYANGGKNGDKSRD